MTLSTEHAIETYKSLITFSVTALGALQLLNGGGAVALLAYLGDVAGQVNLAGKALGPMVAFVIGLILGTAAYFPAYLAQFALFNETARNTKVLGTSHMVWVCFAAVLAVLSLIAFSVGAIWGAHTLSG